MSDLDFFDETMELVSGKEWNYSVLPLPSIGQMRADEIESPLQADEFIAKGLKSPHGVKTTWLLADVLRDYRSVTDVASIGDALGRNQIGDLPGTLRLLARSVIASRTLGASLIS